MDAQPEATLADDEAQLAAFALDLGNRIEAAIPDWVERSLRARGGAAFDGVVAADVAAATAEEIMSPLRVVLAADVDRAAGSPLAALRTGVGPMTRCLDAWGVQRPMRDEFHQRQFPNDPFELGPAAFSEVDPSLHEPGLVWGAARAHVHLRRRREASGG